MMQSLKTIQERNPRGEALDGLIVIVAALSTLALGLFFGWVILALALGGR